MPEAEYRHSGDFNKFEGKSRKMVTGAGLINGKNGNIAPLGYTTRAEVAVVLKRVLDLTEKK